MIVGLTHGSTLSCSVHLDKRHDFTQEIKKTRNRAYRNVPPVGSFHFLQPKCPTRTKKNPEKKTRLKVPAIEISTELIIDHSVIPASFEGQGRMFPEIRQDTSEWNPYN